MLIVVKGGKRGRCSATWCLVDMNGGCPVELRVAHGNGSHGGVACRSVCETFGDPRFCCNETKKQTKRRRRRRKKSSKCSTGIDFLPHQTKGLSREIWARTLCDEGHEFTLNGDAGGVHPERRRRSGLLRRELGGRLQPFDVDRREGGEDGWVQRHGVPGGPERWLSGAA
ncbi:hypothetical protein Fmac_018070 [Flemingia macrophylla]|uniref:Uncharacterized protein n=1 Tax=Flemingia macrophylla TaxID=520843 RepID=A0ABD1M3Y6_9FABA